MTSALQTRSAVKGIQPPKEKTVLPIILWGVSAVLVMALLGFELIGPTANIEWLIFTLLVISGTFLRVSSAFMIGCVSLFLSVGWITWRASLGELEASDLFFVFLSPLAFLPLSALRASVESKQQLDRRVINWRVMPIHQIESVFRFLQNYSKFEFMLSVELHTSNLGFIRSLLGVKAGREQLMALQTILGELIADTGYAFLDYDNSRVRLLLPDTSKEFWQIRFDEVNSQRKGIAIEYAEANYINCN